MGRPDLHQTLLAATAPAGEFAKDAPVLTVVDVMQILAGQLRLEQDGTLVLDTRRKK